MFLQNYKAYIKDLNGKKIFQIILNRLGEVANGEACALRVSSHPVYTLNAIGSSRESNSSCRICNLRGTVTQNRTEQIYFVAKTYL